MAHEPDHRDAHRLMQNGNYFICQPMNQLGRFAQLAVDGRVGIMSFACRICFPIYLAGNKLGRRNALDALKRREKSGLLPAIVAATKRALSVRKIIIIMFAKWKWIEFSLFRFLFGKHEIAECTKVPQLKWKRRRKNVLEIVVHTCLDCNWKEEKEKNVVVVADDDDDDDSGNGKCAMSTPTNFACTRFFSCCFHYAMPGV